MRGRGGFILPALLVVVPFVVVRLPYYWEHPVPGVYRDTAQYFEPIAQVLEGMWPTFVTRTPGYPLFLAAVMSVARDALAVVAAQQAASLAAQLWLVSGVYALRPSLAAWAAIATVVANTSLSAVSSETALMADSLYASSQLVVAGFIVRLFRQQVRTWVLVGASLSMAATILTKPAGLFLVGTWLLLLVLVWRHGISRGGLLSLGIPLPAVLLGLCAYNLATVGEFSVSPWGTANILGATDCYWKTSAAYPPAVNRMIERMQARLTPAERRTLDESWNLSAIGGVYDAHFNDVHYVGMLEDDNYRLKKYRKLLWRIAVDAIEDRPDLYAKFVASQLYRFLGRLSGNDWDSYQKLIAMRASTLLEQEDARTLLVKRLRLRLPDVRQLAGVEVPEDVGDWIGPNEIRLRPPLVVRLLTAVYGVFRGSPWIWMWVAVLLASGWKVLRTRGHDPGASAVFSVATLHLGAGLLVSLVEIGLDRYAMATQFALYVSVALAPLLVPPGGSTAPPAPGVGQK